MIILIKAMYILRQIIFGFDDGKKNDFLCEWTGGICEERYDEMFVLVLMLSTQRVHPFE